ncbi:MAG: glycosyltransferase, partial [Armatimonadota bacterium]
MGTRDTQSPAGAPGQAEGPRDGLHAPSPPLAGRRVAMLTPDYPPDVIGGAGVSCHLLVQQLRERGLIVDVYALTERGPGRRQARPEPSAGVDAPGGTDVRLSAGGGRVGRNLRAFAALRGRLGDYDLVHVYDASLLPAAALIRCLGRPCLKRAAPPRRGQGRPRAPVVMHLNNLQGACFTPELCLKEQCDRHGWLKSIRCAVVDPEPTSRLRRLLLVHPMFHIVNRIG